MPNTEGNDSKQPFKLIEIPLKKFKDEVIPHHQLILETDRKLIEKYISANNCVELQKQLKQRNIVRRQLKNLVYELDTLQNQVEDVNLDEFDNQAKPLKNQINNLIKHYLELDAVAENAIKLYNETSLDDDAENFVPKTCQLELEGDFLDLELYDEQQRLTTINHLNNDIEDVHQIFGNLQELVQQQKESVTTTENNVEVAHENVTWGLRSLIKASKLKAASYPLAGACIGTVIGGPVGSIAGFKIGAVAAIGFGIAGYVGGKLVKKKKIQLDNTQMDDIEMKNQVDGDRPDDEIKKMM